MSWTDVAFAVAMALLLLVWWIWVAASRLDRLHRKVATSRAALDSQLLRRASTSAELASSGLLDPASSVLVADAAWTVLAAERRGTDDLAPVVPGLAVPDDGSATGSSGPRADAPDVDQTADEAPVDRELAESELSRTLRAALAEEDEVTTVAEQPLGRELLAALASSWYRVQLARRFHNEAVAQTQRVRRKALVRLLRLPGHAPWPRTVEIDDDWPEALPRPGQAS